MYSTTIKAVHSTRFAERLGHAPDRLTAIVQEPAYREDGSTYPKVVYIVEVEATREAWLRRHLKSKGYPHTKAAAPVNQTL